MDQYIITTASGRQYARLTGDVLRIAQFHHGICSHPDCDQPISGACPTCHTRYCVAHLDDHATRGHDQTGMETPA